MKNSKFNTKVISWMGITFFVFISLIQLKSQTYYFDNYSVEEGLAQSTVYCILQDQDKYVWMGTKSGVSKFDGKIFENYTVDNGLAPNAVRSIYQDKRGLIWFGHDGGSISTFDGKKFSVVELKDSSFNSFITSITEDKLGRIWIMSEVSGAYLIKNPEKYNSQLLEYEHYIGQKLSNRALSSFISKDSSLFVITPGVVKKLNFTTNQFENYSQKGIPAYFQITCMTEDNEGNYWFGTHHGGLYVYDQQKKEATQYDFLRDGTASNWTTALLKDSRGNIWGGSWGQGVTFCTNERIIQVFNKKNGLDDLKIWCLEEDAEGNILIGTNEHGLFIYKGEQFISYSDKEGLSDKQIWAIHQDNYGDYWFASNYGINILNRNTNEFSYLNSENTTMQADQIRFLKTDKNGLMWIGTNDGGVYSYDIKNQKFYFDAKLNNPIKFSIVTAMDIDNDNNLWIGSIDGLVYYEINTGSGAVLSQIDGLAGNDISAIYCDSKNTIWIGSKGKGVTRIIGSEIEKIERFSQLNPTSFIEDKEGNLWIGTLSQGVFITQKDSILRKIQLKDGLLANLIKTLEKDANGNIYIGTNLGLNKWDTEKEKLYTFTKKNGFTGIETKDNASFLDKEGNLWFGTVQGVTKYQPNLNRTDEIESATHIKSLMINLEARPITNNLVLPYYENSIIIDYNSISLTNPDQINYQVILDGLDKEWNPPTTQTRASYPALPPGKYTFKVKAKNSSGIWNKTPQELVFQIKPPFYKTWWFIIISIVTGALIIISYIKIREKKLVKEKEILEQKVAERTLEVTMKNDELAMKNKDITDSINYAKRIQFAILPTEIPYKDTFILFRPKDIVSGDFYWLMQEGEKEFLCAADCTGHGVPGAFMSIIGHNSLTKIVREYNITEPGKILDALHVEVRKTLHQNAENEESEYGVKDGMDLSIICYNTKTNILEFAGAFNPLYHIRKGELTEIKADRFAIGRYDKDNKNYTNHSVNIEKGDTIYMFSDGYQDQFGGPKGKKFKAKSVRELLLSIQDKPMGKQKELLNNTIENWMAETSLEQIDDIIFVGRKF